MKLRIARMTIFLPFKKNCYQYLICNKENYKFNFILLVLIKDKNDAVLVLTMAACIGNTSVNKLIKSWNRHKMIVNV